MSLHLALDTATDRATLALGTPRGIPVERVVAARRDLSRSIERIAAELLQRAEAAPRDIAGVVVADGPGSFTGLRIGVAFAKGLCRALGVPLLTAPSLLGAARAACAGAGTVAVRYDALRGEVYRAVYHFGADGAVTIVAAPAIVPAGAAADVPAGALVASERHASAAALIRLVGVAGGAARVAEPGGWEPEYGRPAEAEARYLAQHGRLPPG